MRLYPVFLALSSVLLVQGAVAADAEYELGPHVSEYQRFILYPHLQAGFSALARKHRDRAIAEFERARALQPENPVIARYLARAYETFGQDKQALALVRQQLTVTPQDQELQSLLKGLELRAPLDPACGLLECKIARAERSLLDDNLDSLAVALNDPALSHTPQGVSLRKDLLQRALAQRNAPLATTQFTWLDTAGQLGHAERQQWMTMLLAEGRVEQAMALRQRLPEQEGELDLAVALGLAKAGQQPRLASYLRDHSPQFSQARQEREWLQLAADNAVLNLDQPVQFAQNQPFYARLRLPILQREGRWQEIAPLLAETPALGSPELAFELALHQGPAREVARAARALVRSSPQSMAQLDRVSYRLLAGGHKRASQALLAEYWPYEGAPLVQRALLIKRLASLQQQAGVTTLPQQFGEPLAEPELRSLQATMLAQAGQCEDVLHVLGDLSAQYDASSWRVLGICYRQNKPGLAEYAFRRAANLGAPEDIRQFAYQAYENHHFDAALRAWQAVTLAPQSQEMMAAIHAALDAGDVAQARQWLQQYQQAGLPQQAPYWRALARTQHDQQALQSLARVIALDPKAQDYAALAQHHQRLGERRQARDALHQANQREPDNRVYQLAYANALLDNGEPQAASRWLAPLYRPGDAQIAAQLAYIHQALGEGEQARHYAATAIDDQPSPPLLYDLRRLHEGLGRRWTLSLDAWAGTSRGTISGVGGNSIAQSYLQAELEYPLLAAATHQGRSLSLFGRVFGSSAYQQLHHVAAEWQVLEQYETDGHHSNALDIRDPALGLGVRWKPLANQALVLTAEQTLPMSSELSKLAEPTLRASTSFFNDGKYSDEWHFYGAGWVAQNLYMDASRTLRTRQSNVQADYRVSYHHKLRRGDTIEPYGHLMAREYWNDNKGDIDYLHVAGHTIPVKAGSDNYRMLMGGVGVRWNHWFGEDHHNAWRHKMSVGVEYQRLLAIEPSRAPDSDKGALMMTIGVKW